MGVGRGSKATPPFSGSGGSGWKPKLTRSTRSAPKTPGALQVERLTLTLLIKWPFCPTCRMFSRPRRQAGSPLLETARCAHRRRGALLPGPVQPPRATPHHGPPPTSPAFGLLLPTWVLPGSSGRDKEGRQGGQALMLSESHVPHSHRTPPQHQSRGSDPDFGGSRARSKLCGPRNGGRSCLILKQTI